MYMQLSGCHLCAISVVVFLFKYLPSGIAVLISDSDELRSVVICVSISRLISSFCRLWVFSLSRTKTRQTQLRWFLAPASLFPDSSRVANPTWNRRKGSGVLPLLLQCFVPPSLVPSAGLALLVQAGHGACQQWGSTAASRALQCPCASPALLGRTCPWWCSSGQLPKPFQHPGACSLVQEELHNTRCLHIQPARSCMLLLPAFVNSSDRYSQPLEIMPYFSLSSLPSLLSWRNTVSNSSFNPNKLPPAYDYRVALPVAHTVSSLTVSFTSCVAISLAWLRQPAQPANILNKSQGEPYFFG